MALARQVNRFAHTLIGVGLWLATVPKNRPHFWGFPHAATGRGVLRLVNEGIINAEMAKRHAKPSTRKRVV